MPASEAQAVFLERGSRFIGFCAPVTTENEAAERIAEVRKRHADATHNVFAYKLRGGAARQSDDGEPSGTAGSPVFEAITRRGLSNALVVVTRYFGGTLLGAGGLVRAYSRTAVMALDEAGVAEIRPWVEGSVAVAYALYDQTLRLLESHGVRGLEPLFEACVNIRFYLREIEWEPFCTALRNLSGGGAEPQKLGICYLA